MKPTRNRLFLLVVSGFLAAGSLLSAQEAKDTPAKAPAVDGFQFEKKKGDQESANELASELLKRILDIQLRQLRENGLEKEPYFAAIEKMRDNIDDLLKKNMAETYKAAKYPYVDEKQQAELKEEDARLLIIRDAEGPVGFSHFRFECEGDCPVLYVYNLQLAEQICGKGVGRHVMSLFQVHTRFEPATLPRFVPYKWI